MNTYQIIEYRDLDTEGMPVDTSVIAWGLKTYDAAIEWIMYSGNVDSDVNLIIEVE